METINEAFARFLRETGRDPATEFNAAIQPAFGQWARTQPLMPSDPAERAEAIRQAKEMLEKAKEHPDYQPE